MDPLKQARRIVILVIGVTVVVAGVCLLVLPGPAFIVIPAGLAILSTEFVWAARLLKRMRENAEYAANSMIDGKSRDAVWQRFRGWFGFRPPRTTPHSN